ncbi:hypothetical protein EW026_g5957 [Hermanssonia centrifuga]|uniref:Efficient mitochondria targeting-associated protein 19 n=1 Tax=Hermanssonia centrifuga TaxID=98765 RepID=A0A4S4KCR1_9APHY|nr:hypothetical protein EW026_g5957 [Hermanssonia centrifuga]
MSKDPLIGGAVGYFGQPENYVWFKSFLVLEAIFQLPVFFLGMRGLLKGNERFTSILGINCRAKRDTGSRSIYVLILIYGASTTTTTLPCLAVVLATPLTNAETIAANLISITSTQRLLLLSSYVPFFLIPLLMTADMAFRILDIMKAGIRAKDAVKNQ